MGKGIILYQTKYGSTKKYAEWLQEETGYDCIETKHANVKSLQKYNKIIVCILGLKPSPSRRNL